MQILCALWIEESHKMVLVGLDDFHKLIVWTVTVEQHQTQPSTEHSNVVQLDYICALALKRQNKIRMINKTCDNPFGFSIEQAIIY